MLARGWCATHYQRWRTTGDPGGAALLRTPGDPDATEKRCTACGVTKPLDGFYAYPQNLDGRQSQCKPCMIDRQRTGRRRRLYGVDAEHYDRLLAESAEGCPICHEKADRMVIDHCHRSGKVRALLCDRCNRLLGVADDDVALLQAAIRFLRKHQT